MSGYNQYAWLSLCVSLTLLGLIASWLVWRRRGPGAGLRGVAWSLIPVGIYLLGMTELLWRFGAAIADFAGSLVFDIERWAGVAVAVLVVVLFFVSGRLRARRARRAGQVGASTERPVVSGPSTAPGRRAVAAPTAKAGKGKVGADDDFSDIEEILRRRGIR